MKAQVRNLFLVLACAGLLARPAARLAAAPTILASGLNSADNIIVDSNNVYWVEETNLGIAGFPLMIGSVSKTSNGNAAKNYTYAGSPVYPGTLADNLVQDDVSLYYIGLTSAGGVNQPGICKVAKTGGASSIINPNAVTAYNGEVMSSGLAIGPIGGNLYYESSDQVPHDKTDGFNGVDGIDDMVSLSTLGGNHSPLNYFGCTCYPGTNFTINGVEWYYGLAALQHDNSINSNFVYSFSGNAQSISTDSTNLYWSDGATIWSTPLIGGMVSVRVPARTNTIEVIATPATGAAAGSLFWVEEDGGGASLMRQDASGHITTLLPASPDIFFYNRCFAVNDDEVYCGYAGGLVEVSINGGAIAVLAAAPYPNNPVSVATDGSNVYWSAWNDDGGGGYSGHIMRLALSGGTVNTNTGTSTNSATTLDIAITGNGTVSPNLNGKSLATGTSHTIKAAAGKGYIFSNWVASGGQDFVSNKASLTFMMSSNLVLQANFVTNPFPSFAGVYEGLCMNASNVTLESSGSFKMTVGEKGSFTANLVLAGQNHPFAGQFSAGGFASNLVAPNSAALTVLLQLDLTGSNVVTGTVRNGVWLAELSAYHTKLYSLGAADKYTVAISGNVGSTTEPGGDGFGSLTVNTAGSATFAGVLADDTTVTETASVSQGGLWPFYASLYSGKGMIIGWLALTNETGSDLNGSLTWIKGQVNTAKYYANGFTTQPQVVGSLYDNTTPILKLTDSLFYLTGGNLTDDLTNTITLADNNHVSSTNTTLKLTFTAGTGKFQGTVKNPVTGGLPETLSFKGVVLQKQNVGVGFCLGADQNGLAGIGSNSIVGMFGPPFPP